MTFPPYPEAIHMVDANGFVRSIAFHPAWDKTHADNGKNYGISCVHMVVGLTGPEGTLACDFFTDWYLKKNQAGVDKHNADRDLSVINRLGSVDFHAPKPWKCATELDGCSWTGGKCWCDGSSLLGGELLELFIEQGLEALFVRMAEIYKDWAPFEDSPE